MSDFELSDSYHQFFKKTLADQYYYGVSWFGHSQIPAATQHDRLHYVAIIKDDVDFGTVRHKIVDYHTSQPPCEVNLYCIHQQDFEIFSALNSCFFERLKRFGWHSLDSLDDEHESKTKIDDSGWMAWQTMQATADLYADQSNNLRLSSLLPQPIIDANEADKGNLYGAQEQVKQLIQQNMLQKLQLDVPEKSAPPFNFPEPVAIYLKLDQLILVSNSPAEALTASGQKTIEKWMDQHAATAVQVCTPAQLFKAVEAEDLVAARLMSYQHIWGASVLKSLRYDPTKILTGAANVAAYWQFYGISYLLFNKAVSDETDRQTIHDLQNRLLNIRLQNELFSRFGYSDKGIPDIEIPDRSAPISSRLQAIQDLFAWWTTFYLDQINND